MPYRVDDTKDKEPAPTPARSRAAVADEPETPPEPPKPGEVVRQDGGIDKTDILGGGIKETVNVPVSAATKDRERAQRILLRAAKASGTRKLGALVGRPLDEWGLVGEGDELRGHYILVDLDTLDKIEVGPDYFKVEGDHIYANAQQLPKALVAGDGLSKL